MWPALHRTPMPTPCELCCKEMSTSSAGACSPGGSFNEQPCLRLERVSFGPQHDPIRCRGYAGTLWSGWKLVQGFPLLDMACMHAHSEKILGKGLATVRASQSGIRGVS